MVQHSYFSYSKVANLCVWLLGLTVISMFILDAYTTAHISGRSSYVGRFLNRRLTLPKSWLHTTIERLIKEPNGMAQLNVSWSNANCTKEFKKGHYMTTWYQGRTANLLFQFAVLLATAEQACYTAILTPDYLKHLDTILDLKGVKRLRYDEAAFRRLPEPGWSTYDENLISQIRPEHNWIIDGYRQSFRYFGNYSQFIRSSICFKDVIKKTVHMYLEEGPLSGKIKVCLHVRRGDLVEMSKNRTLGHIMSDLDYINRAKKHMTEYVSPLNFSLVVVSDDISWCRQNIKGDNVYYSPFKEVGEDFYLLTQCDHSIITTTSFGWLSAWLNETGLVIYDKLYASPHDSLAAKGHVHTDYYPSHWVGL